MLWPPYWLDATCAMICVAMLQAVEKRVRLFNQSAADDRAVLQHIVQIDEVAVVHVLGIVVGIVEVDDALLMRLDDLRAGAAYAWSDPC